MGEEAATGKRNTTGDQEAAAAFPGETECGKQRSYSCSSAIEF